VLVYHLVCVAKYRRVVFDASVEAVLREVYLDIALRFEITFWKSAAMATTFIFWFSRCRPTAQSRS